MKIKERKVEMTKEEQLAALGGENQTTSVFGKILLVVLSYQFVSFIYAIFLPHFNYYFQNNNFFSFPLFALAMLSIIVVHHVVFWGLNLAVYIPLDLAHIPHYLRKYKTQPKTNVTVKDYITCAKVVLFNQHCINLPFIALTYPLFSVCGVALTGPMPSMIELLKGLLVCLAVEEVMFYYSHLLLHHRSIYKYVHKQHHEFTAPIGIAAEYAHPIESIVSNTAPVITGVLVAGLVLGGTHITLLWIWLCLALSNTVVSHSGYNFPFSPTSDSRPHDFHHSSFRDNYGAIGALDWLHGTDKKWREHLHQLDQERARILKGE